MPLQTGAGDAIARGGWVRAYTSREQYEWSVGAYTMCVYRPKKTSSTFVAEVRSSFCQYVRAQPAANG
jgi:hypothetical protein